MTRNSNKILINEIAPYEITPLVAGALVAYGNFPFLLLGSYAFEREGEGMRVKEREKDKMLC